MKNKIMYTENYDKFKIKYGNRPVSTQRVNQIVKSIQEIGWFCNPVLVNEQMEIIDGQHRYAALKSLKMPIEYSVCPGADLKEARVLNTSSKNWMTQNYIDSYAADGNINYINFKALQKKYPKLDMTSIACVVSDRVASSNQKVLRTGRLVLPTDKLDQLFMALDFVMANYDSIKRIEGRRSIIISGVTWIVCHTDVDKRRLSKVLHNSIFPPVADSMPKRWLESVSNEYNKRLKKDKQIKFDALYELTV